jgi:hypothetical protein
MPEISKSRSMRNRCWAVHPDYMLGCDTCSGYPTGASTFLSLPSWVAKEILKG